MTFKRELLAFRNNVRIITIEPQLKGERYAHSMDCINDDWTLYLSGVQHGPIQ